jgi:hypothetical protein
MILYYPCIWLGSEFKIYKLHDKPKAVKQKIMLFATNMFKYEVKSEIIKVGLKMAS